ncbi:hypothetical protein EMIHUDRAFT_77935, partial [Emiliania huxleyi CCMP1516]|uniref:BolA-like protein n=2 Tax=Emiliania huxleyi TaxID=2903 RepID=A0A0D3KMI9_EMIH1
GPVAASITAKLEAAFKPDVLDVVNESASHNVPRGSESHFKDASPVAHAFASVPLLERHRLVNEALADELKGPVHALTIVAKTPAQWAKASGAVPPSPPCLGGSKA